MTTKNHLKAAYWLGAIDADRVPPIVAERLADRVLADLEEDDSDDQTELNERSNGYAD